MNTIHFEALIHALTTAATRRGLLAALGGGLVVSGLPGLGIDETAAKRNSRGRRKRKRRAKRKQRQDGTQQPPPQTPLPPSPVTRADATCDGGGPGVLVLADENSRLAQTFTALASGPLVRADLDIAKPTGSGGDLVLRLSPVRQAGEAIVPTNDLLAETSVANAAVPEGGSVVTFAFATPFSVVAGTQYALVLTRPDGGRIAWIGRDGNPCSGAASLSPDQTGSFLDIGSDLFFTIFVTS